MAKENKTKRMKVKQKDYLALIAPQHAIKLWGNDKDMLKTNDPQNEIKKDTRQKVKQKDLLTLMKMQDDKDSQDGRNKSLLKSTKQRREIFTDGYQVESQELKKRMVFTGSDMNHKQERKQEKESKRAPSNASTKVKKNVSKEGQSYLTLPKHESKYRHQKLNEETRVDLGTVLHDRLKNWSPHIGLNKVKLPTFGSTSKSYDVLKAKEEKAPPKSLESKKSSTVTNSEIYISLEKKSLQEKEDIKQSNPQLFNDYAEFCNECGRSRR